MEKLLIYDRDRSEGEAFSDNYFNNNNNNNNSDDDNTSNITTIIIIIIKPHAFY